MSHEFEARVYDLDGTLVRLDVDWQEAASDVVAVYEDAGHDVDPDRDLWSLVNEAGRYAVQDEVEAVLSEHERAGAEASEALPLADEVDSTRDPIGVCSLNCEDAVEIALEKHGLDRYVNSLVGRDTLREQKPDPTPLLTALDQIGATPVSTVFIGDSATDEQAAERAGIPFQWVEDRVQQHY
ncbi:HAD family hydrolase [Salinarchaeum sp. Harcht-Bsk1]|uniref:HAD family hydrolase n=1 Tax=Salinarchaeum sp. Harcht-Bsk1 TaxID=1333523 RepID=UPI00191C4285|nr:HAD-IA family hydrolase [Salinarchaeum sp. Harcht-Bsk1]